MNNAWAPAANQSALAVSRHESGMIAPKIGSRTRLWWRETPWVVGVVVAVALVALGACGRGGDESPAPLAVSLVPARVATGELTLVRDRSKETTAGLRADGDDFAVGQSGLWEIRQGDELVGALQLSMLKGEVDLGEAKQRDQIVRGVAPTGRRQRVGKTQVVVQKEPDKSVYFWFRESPKMYLVLQLKSRGFDADPDAVLADVLAHQAARNGR